MNYRNKAGLKSMLDLVITVLAAYAMYTMYQKCGTGMFGYYSVCSVFYLLVVCFVCADYTFQIMRAKNIQFPKFLHLFKYFAVCTSVLALVQAVFVTAPMTASAQGITLGQAEAASLLKGENLYLNLICPILGVISLLLCSEFTGSKKSVAIYALIPTLVYAVVIIILNGKGSITGPAPFDTAAQPWYMTVVWFAAFAAAAYGIAYGLFCAWKACARPYSTVPAKSKKK